ncbi:MAG TPA: RIP metalloprotease RseP, partial [Flavobacteriaceae bacterium]|nr:RIP metalloprotease RseP [Flavobacteriaceae bacterium]
MDVFLIKALQLILSLAILVVLHELGHFIPAKIFKTRVEKFYLFFDVKFSLFKKKIGETVYGIGWLPLGGYVKISGMIDESFDKEQMSKPPQPWEFRSKPTWQRLIIMLGGVTVNLIVGFALYMMILFVWGKDIVPGEKLPDGFDPSPVAVEIGFEQGDRLVDVDGKPLENVLDINRSLFLRPVEYVTVKRTDGTIDEINIPEDFGSKMFKSGEYRPLIPLISATIDSVFGSPALNAGINSGDKILRVNDDNINTWQEFVKWIDNNDNDIINIALQRGNSIYETPVKRNDDGTIGVSLLNTGIEVVHRDLSLTESIVEGFDYGYWTLYEYVSQFQYVFTKEGASQLGGFGTIGGLFPAQWDWRNFWSTTALISIILAFMNILPIPALDGGHVMFLCYEMVTGRKPSDKFLEYAQVIG